MASKAHPMFDGIADDDELLVRVADYYHQTATTSDDVKAYLASRKLDHPDLISTFKLGHADRTLGLHLPERNRVAGADIRERLQRVGLYRASGHEHFNGALVVPFYDSTTTLVELYGRKIGERLRPGTALHLWLHENPSCIFNVTGIEPDKPVIVTGSVIDALTLWCHGHQHVVSMIGTDPSVLVTAFASKGVEQVYLAFRRSDDGDRLAELVSTSLADEGIETFRVVLPADQDVNDVARGTKDPADALGSLVRQAVWMRSGNRVVPPVTPAPDVIVPVEVAPPAIAPMTSVKSAGSPVEPVEPESEPLITSSHPAPSPAPADETPAAVIDEHVFTYGDRRWRIRGLARNLSFEQMKLNVMVTKGDAYFVDTFEMYASKARSRFVEQAAEELGVDAKGIKSDIGKVLLALEALQEQQIRKALEPKVPTYNMSDEEREEALAMLRDPELLDRIGRDFDRCGTVNERTNKIIAHLVGISRKLDEPLALVIQSSSAAGKSSLMDAVLAFVPEEDRVQYSALTGQSLFYMPPGALKHKILAVAEEEGAKRTSYSLKLLQSEGSLSIASTAKEANTGRLVTETYEVEGPVGLMLTTTSTSIDEELANRCIVLTVDEGRDQTKAIHVRQRARQTLEGVLAAGEREQLVRLHRNAQRLLKPVLVVNPHAPSLTFVDHAPRTRRDHPKYLTLIRAIALLHQYQREVRTTVHGGKTVTYVEATKADVGVADRLFGEVLRRSLDHLPPQTRRVLGLVEALVHERAEKMAISPADVRFTRRELLDYTHMGHTQIKLHLARLVDGELLVRHRTLHPSGGQAVTYELLPLGSEVGVRRDR